jgi:iron complex outermembrane receptor protein
MLSDRTSTLDVSALSPDHAVTIEMLLVDTVEIIRGPASLLYGSDAVGGIINVTDGKIPKTQAETPVSAGLEVRGDTASDERAIVGRLDGGFGNFAWHLDGYDRNTENLEIAGFATADPAQRPANEVSGILPNSYSESDGFSAGASWVGERGYLGASVATFNSTYGLPGPVEPASPGEPLLFEGPFLDMEQTRVDVRGEYNLEDAPFETIKVALATNNYTHQEIEATGEVATTWNNDQWQARAEAVHSELAGFRGALGLQLDSRDLAALGEEAFISPTETRALGVFIAEERAFDWGGISAGARAETLEHRNDVFGNYDNTALSLSAGIAVDTIGNNTIITNLSYSQRNPNTEELYSDGAHIATRQFEVGLLAQPGTSATTENSLNIELGLQRNEGAVQWDVSVFYYDIADYIYQAETGIIIDDLPEVLYTQADADFYGAEGALNFPLWQTGKLQNNLRLFGDIVKAELKDGSKLPRIPPWRVGGNFVFGPEPWQVGLDVIYHAKQDDISSFNTDAYTMVNLSFTYDLELVQNNWQLFVRGTNLADENARKSTSFLAEYAPLPGRALQAGFRTRF